MSLLLDLLAAVFPCFPGLSAPKVRIRGRTYRIIRLLGEGAFSYVYLVADSQNPASQYALKKVRCSFGKNDESYRTGRRELENYARFTPAKCPYIVLPIDLVVFTEPDNLISIYVVLPYFESSLQDRINSHVLSGTPFPQSEILSVFIGVCRAIKVMHLHRGSASPAYPTDAGDAHSARLDEQDALLGLEPDPDHAGGDVSMHSVSDCPYVHHDIKPANVMILREGLAVLVDLGSCSPARVSVSTRQQALSVTDFALQHCTLPYRAPELLDVQTGASLSEKTDMWSLGCLLYCCCFGSSPFEKLEHEEGANLNVAIAQGRYNIPQDLGGYSPELISIVRDCLVLDPALRPDVLQVLERALALASM